MRGLNNNNLSFGGRGSFNGGGTNTLGEAGNTSNAAVDAASDTTAAADDEDDEDEQTSGSGLSIGQGSDGRSADLVKDVTVLALAFGVKSALSASALVGASRAARVAEDFSIQSRTLSQVPLGLACAQLGLLFGSGALEIKFEAFIVIDLLSVSSHIAHKIEIKLITVEQVLVEISITDVHLQSEGPFTIGAFTSTGLTNELVVDLNVVV